MHLETNAIYVCVDGRNGEAHVLIPKDPDAAEYRLLKDEMEEFGFELL